VSRRFLITAVAASLAVAGLAGCRTNVGVAARVDGHRITESDVNRYLAPSGVDKQVADQATSQGGQVPAPRSQVLQVLIQEQLFRRVLADQGIRPSEGDLAKVHDESAAAVLQTDLRGIALDTALDKRLPAFGIKKSFRPALLRTQELEFLFVKKAGGKAQSQLTKANISVSVSPRYGAWDPKTLTLGNDAVLPSFVTAQTSSGAGS
jgi:SurA N-terminal domain